MMVGYSVLGALVGVILPLEDSRPSLEAMCDCHD
jgi:hypothetical protein